MVDGRWSSDLRRFCFISVLSVKILSVWACFSRLMFPPSTATNAILEIQRAVVAGPGVLTAVGRRPTVLRRRCAEHAHPNELTRCVPKFPGSVVSRHRVSGLPSPAMKLRLCHGGVGKRTVHQRCPTTRCPSADRPHSSVCCVSRRTKHCNSCCVCRCRCCCRTLPECLLRRQQRQLYSPRLQ